MSNTSYIHTGKIKFYNEEKGYGFIIDDNDHDEEYFFNKTPLSSLLRESCSIFINITRLIS